jgi:hypothetical protein|tara:strand:- start:141 stop:293 length:153 start_codon:yes stop_codon:yes gene_type:complete
MDISKLQDMEVKALLYDMMTERERIDNNIKLLKAELNRRAAEKEKQEKEE